LFTDQAAENASRQFNATSENQTKQFFAQLDTQVSQFNASQANAQAQFNAGQENAISQFNTEVRNQRDQFNANNRLVIDQNNAQWRRQIATADTAAINRANEINAQNLLGISNTAYNNLWQYYSDAMQYAWTSAENERDRVKDLAVAHLDADNNIDVQKMQNDYNSSVGFGKLIGAFMFGSEFLFG
jgi:uridylate kinase